RGKGFVPFEGGTELIRRAVPIEDGAISVPSQCRRVADRIGQNDGARRRRGDVAKRSGGFQIERAAVDLKVRPDEIVGAEHRSFQKVRGNAAASRKSGEAAGRPASP